MDKCEEKCSVRYETKYEPYTEEHCEDNWSNVCDKVWKSTGYGPEKWVEECKRVNNPKCSNIQKQREKRVPYNDCKEHCYKVPERKCRQVTKQRCEPERYRDCKDHPVKKCKPEHLRIPREVIKEVCDGGHSGASRNPHRNDPYNAQAVSDAFVNNQGNRNPVGSDYNYESDYNNYEDDYDGDDYSNLRGDADIRQGPVRNGGQKKDDSKITFGR